MFVLSILVALFLLLFLSAWISAVENRNYNLVKLHGKETYSSNSKAFQSFIIVA
jgi:hypothetical protein